jgi:hypothetical protein
MKTTINKVFQVSEPIEKVWHYLSDPTKIVGCVPGASITEKKDDKNYTGQVSLKFGPVKSVYNGEIVIEELDTTTHRMVLQGKGLDSKGKGSADMTMNGLLTPKDGGTEVNFTMDVAISGMLAQFGSRLINDVSDQLLNQFVASFSQLLKADSGAADAAATGDGQETPDNALDATALAGTVVKGFVKRLFGS